VASVRSARRNVRLDTKSNRNSAVIKEARIGANASKEPIRNGASAGTNADTKRIGKFTHCVSGGILSLAAFVLLTQHGKSKSHLTSSKVR
jgi:hypothetical protein